MELGLIGYPLTHSLSKEIFIKKFQQHKIQATYQNFAIKNMAQFSLLIKKKPLLKGLNVTIPYKKKIIPYLNYVDPLAQKVQAVNTIKINHNQCIGYNTDVKAFAISLKNWISPYIYFQALILGTGGAARAVAKACQDLQIKFKYVSRKPLKSQFSYQNLVQDPKILTHYQLIINCTPLGMYPNIEQCPTLPYHWVNNIHYLYDLVYNPPITTFLKEGLKQGAKIKNGYEMLRLQAEYAWKIWKNSV